MKVLIPHQEIVEMCKRIGSELSAKFKDKTPIVVCTLKGACPFHSELIKHMDIDMELDYIQISSYVGTESTGKTTLKQDLSLDIKNRDVIVVEDIVDTGITLQSLKKILLAKEPKSLTFVTMLDKPSRRKVDIKADYIGKAIDDLFVIGFGLDLDEKYRNLKDVCVYDEN